MLCLVIIFTRTNALVITISNISSVIIFTRTNDLVITISNISSVISVFASESITSIYTSTF